MMACSGTKHSVYDPMGVQIEPRRICLPEISMGHSMVVAQVESTSSKKAKLLTLTLGWLPVSGCLGTSTWCVSHGDQYAQATYHAFGAQGGGG